jgi:hypothetical protein
VSISSQRDQVARLANELAALDAKAAVERDRASKERSEALRLAGSITKSTSASTAISRARDAQRREERAVKYDRQAAQYASQSASKRQTLSQAETRLAQAEASERKKVAADAEKARRDDQRRRTDLDNTMRAVAEYPRLSRTFAPSGQPEVSVDVRTGSDGDLRESVVVSDRGVARLPAETPADATLELAKAVALGSLASVPILGPVLREVIGVAWGDNRAARVERFASELARDVETMLDRIDREFVRREEFGALAEETLDRIVLKRNERKISRFSAAVAHSATRERPDQRTRDRYLDWLDQLRPIHLEILRRFGRDQSDWVRPLDVFTVGQVAGSRVSFALRGLDVDGVELRELEQRGLTLSLESSSLLLVAEDVRAVLTPAGRDFLAFVTSGAGEVGT